MANLYGGSAADDSAAAQPAFRWAPAPPPQWGPASADKRPPAGRRRNVSPKLVVGVAGPVVVLIVLVAVLGAIWPGFLNRKVLDAAAVQQEVLTVLRGDYQLDADNVACPTGQPVDVGSRFSCSAQIAGVPKTVTVTVKSSDGRFEVGRPQ